MEMNRRTLAKGAAWAAPVVVASAAVPAYAASQETCNMGSFTATSPGTSREGTTTTWTVPAGVNAICFTVLGGAGGTGGTNNVPQPGGAGAKVTGTLPVKPGDELTLIVGAGGSNERRGPQQAGTEVSLGGTGYGNGGDVNHSPYTGVNVGRGDNVIVQRMGGSGGAGSAILLNGQPVVIAGGGGGGGNNPTYSVNFPTSVRWNGTTASNTNHPVVQETTSTQVAGSAGGASADAYNVTMRTNISPSEVVGATYSFGSGAKAGVAGVGGASGPNDGVTTDTAYNLTKQYVPGGSGESVAAPGPAKGGDANYLDNTESYPKSGKSARAISVSGGGGGGYGGGGAGSVTAYHGFWKGSTNNENYFMVILSTGNPGAAGGSYVASSVADGAIAQGDNTNTTPMTRVPGAISFTF